MCVHALKVTSFKHLDQFIQCYRVNPLLSCMCIESPSEPFITLLGPPVESGDAAPIATCTSTGFWPADINMTWTVHGGPIEPALNQKVKIICS